MRRVCVGNHTKKPLKKNRSDKKSNAATCKSLEIYDRERLGMNAPLGQIASQSINKETLFFRFSETMSPEKKHG